VTELTLKHSESVDAETTSMMQTDSHTAVADADATRTGRFNCLLSVLFTASVDTEHVYVISCKLRVL